MSTVLHLKLHRAHHGPGYCVGRLHVDNEWQCFTLEDEVREIETRPVQEWKIPGRTAIPRGTYEVVITLSNRFERRLPLLLNVPGFTGVRIHSGNTSEDTEGCILVGRAWDGGDRVSQSRLALGVLQEKIELAIYQGRKVYLEVE